MQSGFAVEPGAKSNGNVTGSAIRWISRER